jgi:hypothetical protein
MKSKILLLLLTITIAFSCGEEQGDTEQGFNRRALLEEMALNLIIPNFEALQSSVNDLSNSIQLFEQNRTEENVTAMQMAWVDAVINFQHCSAFGFGPASLPLGPFATVLGVFPVDVDQVEANITVAEFNLASSFDRDVRGLYAIEFLIYGGDPSNAKVSETLEQERLEYLKLIVSELQLTVDGIVDEWKSSYIESFINNDGTSAGSSISLLYNEFVKDYENLKNFKVELPAGLTAGQTGSDPTLVEAYYSGISKELIRHHFASSKNIWLGQTRDGQQFTGFEEYLNSVVGGAELVESTKTALHRIDQAIAAIPDGRFSDQLETTEVTILRDELQSNTANFKSSMSSLLGISITFNSGDGD